MYMEIWISQRIEVPWRKKNAYSGKMHNFIKNYFQNMILALKLRVADFNSNTMKRL